MKNLMIKGSAVLIMLAMSNFTLFARDGRERVKFAKGATSAVLTRTVSSNMGSTTFILYVKKGQIMNFSVDENAADLGISLSDAGSHDAILESASGEPNEYQVAKSGDHFITVVNRSKRKASFTLRVVVK